MQISPKSSPISGRLGAGGPPSSIPNTDRTLSQRSRFKSESGFTLAEIAVALGIFSFALVSMLGLLSVGMKNARRANVQTAATNLMAGIAADINASTKTVGGGTQSYTSPKFRIVALVKSDSSIEVASTIANPMILTESGAFLNTDSITPSLIEKNYLVQLIPPSVGTRAVRVRMEWPGNRPPNSNPEGSIETIVPLPF